MTMEIWAKLFSILFYPEMPNTMYNNLDLRVSGLVKMFNSAKETKEPPAILITAHFFL